MRNQTSQVAITPQQAIQMLKEGNERFQKNVRANHNLNEQIRETSTGQYPFAVVLGCIDSRVSHELVFDQGIGDIFSIRIAGNFVNTDIIGSMEFACKVAGAKLIVTLGHTSCGAIKGVCNNVQLGNLTTMLENLRPALEATPIPEGDSMDKNKNTAFVNEVAKNNVRLTTEKISSESQILSDMNSKREIAIVGAMYDVCSGKIIFYE